MKIDIKILPPGQNLETCKRKQRYGHLETNISRMGASSTVIAAVSTSP